MVNVLANVAGTGASAANDAGAADLARYCRRLRGLYAVNRRLLLVQFPQVLTDSFEREVAVARGYYAFPPTGLQCLYEALRPRGLDVRILDLNLGVLRRVHEDSSFDVRRWPELLAGCLDAFDPFVVGVSCMFDAALGYLTTALKMLRDRNRSVVIAGGIIPTHEYAYLLDHDLCHFVVRHEGERRMDDLMGCLLDDGDSDDCDKDDGPAVAASPVAADGICFRRGERTVQTQRPSQPVRQDSDMIASYALVPIEDYAKYGSMNPFARMSGRPFAAVQMNRGCRGSCNFCSVRSFMGGGVRGRPVESVLAEIQYLVERRGIEHFEWLDDDLLFYRKELLDLLEKISARRLGITWSSSNGLIARSLDRQMLTAMRDSGCVGFRVGIETGNAEMLKRIRKPGTLDTFRQLAALLPEFPEIFVCGNFMLGFPRETFGQMMDSFLLHMELQLDWGGFTVCQPIRGASLFDDCGSVFQRQLATDGASVRNYIPVRQSAGGRMEHGNDIAVGTAVFRLPPDAVPAPDQVNEIWFAFNLVANYLNNKNLRPGGRPRKIIAWLQTARVPYPHNPYMSLFLALAYRLAGEGRRAEEFFDLARWCSKSDYWQSRLADFELTSLLDRLPQTGAKAAEAIDSLRLGLQRHYQPYLDRRRPNHA